ncbi:MAG: DEAD/DEAH box helicase family protein [Candidatus Methanomethylophilaceae archaeon]|nr:DEAD/DEAH box helicase family protein [Candidatus Methanomethylophilaceae archaeon]
MNYIVHPRIVPGKVEERMYQVSMARGCVSSNTLLILPTGLGKTIVAVNVTADFLSKGRILLMAPTKPLVEQHFEEFSNLLVDADIGVMTGNMKPERRAELMSTCDVVISTPQSVANDLEAGRYDLSGFSLIIYDEAHRGTGNYAYVRVARFKEKNTRSVGMTASPGSDAGKIEEVCMNLGFRRIDIRSDYDPDVSPYVHDTFVNRVEVNMPQDLSDTIALLRSMLDHYISEMVSLHLMNGNWPASTKHLLVVGENLQRRLARGEKTAIVFRGLTLQSMCIKLLHAINLAETQGMSALRNYLSKLETEASAEKGGKGAKELTNRDEYSGIRGIVDRTNVEHPKISRVMSLVSKTVNNRPGSKVIVFTQYRDTCELLTEKLSTIPGAVVGKLIGQSNGGLKQKEQIGLLERFRNGDVNVVVSTSVGEEGLDVSSTDAVIFYEPVPSEIRTIQRRGRTGRKNDGEVYVLIAKGTVDEIFERTSKQKEEAMRARLEKLSDDLSRGSSTLNRRDQTNLDAF